MSSVPHGGGAAEEHLRRQLSVRDWAVLRDVASCRLMSGQQVQRLHFGSGPAAARAARRLLARLTSQRLLGRLVRQIGGVRAGSSGFVYGLGPLGYRLLRPDRPSRRLHEVRDGFLSHTLAVTEVFVGLRQADGRGELDLLTLETEPQAWRRQDDGDWLKPDLYTVVGVGDEALHSFVEVDRGSEHSPALTRKLRQYEAAYRSGAIEAAAGTFPRVVWLVPDIGRVALLQRLSRSRGLTAELHVSALHCDAVAVLSGGDHEQLSERR